MSPTMNTQTSGYMVVFGVLLILLGVAGYMTHPEKAHTALISGGGFGALSILWGILGAKGVRLSLPAAFVTTTLLSLACVWRGIVGWVAVSQGESAKLVPSMLITMMLAVSVTSLSMLLKSKPRPNHNLQPKE